MQVHRGASAFQTRVGRRLLTLFVVSALVPVCALAALTWREVRTQLEKQSQRELRDDAKRLALDVVGRLQHAAREAHDMASVPSPELSKNPDAMIDEIVVLSLDGAQVLGNDGGWEALRPAQPKLLQAGQPVLLNRRGPAHLWMGILSSRGSRTLIAGRIRSDRLLADAIEQTLPKTSMALIADDRGEPIYRAGDDLAWPVVPADMSGLLTWSADERWVGAYFKPPLTALYGVSHWTVAVATREGDVYAPVSGFLWQFLLVVVFTIGVVSLLSLSQVRRELVPLALLRESSKRLAGKDFTTPVVVSSGDEFEELAQSFDQMRGALRQTFDTLESLSAIDRAVLSSLDTSQIATTVVTSVAHVVTSSAVACIIANDDATSSTTLWRSHAGAPVLTLPSGVLSADFFADVREWTAGARGDVPVILHPLVRDEATILLTVPVPIEQRLAAVLVVTRAGTERFRPEDRDVVVQIAGQVAVALTNAGLLQRLESLNFGTLNALARTIDAKSPWTAGHSERVTGCGVALARRLGLDDGTVAEMRRGGLLHDIGKIAIPNYILDKPSALTADEMAIVKRHPEVGARILEPIVEYAGAIPIVLEHHERWDGTGYPFGRRGEAISLGGRIFALADVFDALTSDRPYRPGWPIDKVTALFTRETGHHFDPSLAPVFIELIPELALPITSRRSAGQVEALSA